MTGLEMNILKSVFFWVVHTIVGSAECIYLCTVFCALRKAGGTGLKIIASKEELLTAYNYTYTVPRVIRQVNGIILSLS